MIDATQMSPAEQKAFYDEQGYVVHPDLLNRDELAVLRAALDEVLEEAKGLTDNTEKFSVKRGEDGEYHVRRIFNPIAHHKAFNDLLYHPRLLDAVEALIGPNIQLHHSKLNLKPPSSREARFEWHQDYPYLPALELRPGGRAGPHRRGDEGERLPADHPGEPQAGPADARLRPRRRVLLQARGSGR